MSFLDRHDAGRQLGERLAAQPFIDPIVLALPRGGVPVAIHVAAALEAPVEVFVARKVGAPGQPEFGIGAVAEGSDDVVVTQVAAQLGIGPDQMRVLAERVRAEVVRRVTRYRGDRPLPQLKGRDVIVVDDGLATGVTAEATLHALRAFEPRRLILAAPVCPPDTARRLARVADDVVCLALPTDLRAIGAWYERFPQISDEEVLAAIPPR